MIVLFLLTYLCFAISFVFWFDFLYIYFTLFFYNINILLILVSRYIAFLHRLQCIQALALGDRMFSIFRQAKTQTNLFTEAV